VQCTRWRPSAIPVTPPSLRPARRAAPRPASPATRAAASDDETYFASAHGKRYLAEGTAGLVQAAGEGNYEVPTCAYCHMEARHQSRTRACGSSDCSRSTRTRGNACCASAGWPCARLHDAAQSRPGSRISTRSARRLANPVCRGGHLKDLRADTCCTRSRRAPPYPLDDPDDLWRSARRLFRGQASAFYNVSAIERDYFEMCTSTTSVPTSGSARRRAGVQRGHAAMAAASPRSRPRRDLRASRGRAVKDGRRRDPGDLWLAGPTRSATVTATESSAGWLYISMWLSLMPRNRQRRCPDVPAEPFSQNSR